MATSASMLVMIEFQTTQFAPSNFVTLMCDDALKGRADYGEYYDGAWHFELAVSPSCKTTTIVFKLNNEVEMEQAPVQIRTDVTTHRWTEKNVSFPASKYTPRHIHHIDKLVTEDNDFQRRYIPSNVDTSVEYNVIVIGSGMGGGIVADALLDYGCKVLVLEGGSVHQPQNIVNVPVPNDTRYSVSYIPVPGTGLAKHICMNFGGRSIYWSALIPRMNSWEMSYWPQPIRKYLINEGYDWAEALFRKRTEYNPFQQELRRKVEAAFPHYHVDFTPRSFHSLESTLPRRRGWPDEIPTGTFSTAALLLNSVTHDGLYGRDNLTINLNHLVTHIKTKRLRATSVVCWDLVNNRMREYKADFVVLAAGATESPCIALNSNLKDWSGKIGRGLTDHQTADLVFEIPRHSPLFSSDDQAKLLLRPKSAYKAENQYTCELALNWKFWDVRYEDDDLWSGKFPKYQPIKCTIKFAFGKELDDENWIRPRHNDKHQVHVKLMKERPFKDEVSALKDEVLRFFGVTVKSSYRKRLKYREEAETYHLGGSLRLGEPGDAVVDCDLRFHEYENLYCCDLSVFPFTPMANPSLTLGALALRLANHIAQKVHKNKKLPPPSTFRQQVSRLNTVP